MAYIVLVVGIVLIVYGARGLKGNDSLLAPKDEQSFIRERGFQELLFQKEVLQQLEAIDEKLTLAIKEERNSVQKPGSHNPSKVLESHESFQRGVKNQLHIRPQDLNELNQKIWRMYDDGMDIEEISKILGISKGEVLLRVGIKK